MHRDDPPGELEAPLQLSDGHLDEQHAEQRERETKLARHELPASSE